VAAGCVGAAGEVAAGRRAPGGCWACPPWSVAEASAITATIDILLIAEGTPTVQK